MWYDIGKLYIKSISIKYGSQFYFLRNSIKNEILQKIRKEKEKPDADNNVIYKYKNELKDLENLKNQKVFLYTHTTIRETGEVPSRYFYSLLKANKSKAQINTLVSSEGKLLTEQDDIMDEVKNYYHKLLPKQN